MSTSLSICLLMDIRLLPCSDYRASLVAQMAKNMPAMQEIGFNPWIRKIPWRRAWQLTPVSLPGESYGQTMGLKESNTTEQLMLTLLMFWL